MKELISSIPNEFNILEAKRHNFVPVEYSGKFYEYMIYRKIKSLNHLGAPLPPKVTHRAIPNIIVHQGNHKVSGFAKPVKLFGGIIIFHFPIRTYKQFLNKIKKGAAYERNKHLKKSIGETWRKLYKIYKENESLETVYRKQCYSTGQIRVDLESGKIIKDIRLKNYLSALYKQSDF